jgi:Domain of unknown function (DUF4350)
MPTGIAPSDKKLLLGGGALILFFLVATAVLSPPQEQEQSPVPSTYSAQSAGAEAAYRLLTKLHYPVRRWENPPTELYQTGPNSLLILAEPSEPPSAEERKALTDFVEDGGHVLFTGPNLGAYFPQVKLSEEIPDPIWKSFVPSLPTRLTRGAQHITLQPHAYWKKLAADQFELYRDAGSPVVVSWTPGGGEILWWAGSTPLSNAGITREDNLAFFLNAVGNWDEPAPYHIYWDEYFHGQRSNLWSYVQKTSLSWSIWQIAILALAVLFTFSRRSGPVFVPAEVSRLSPLEFVDTLGGLYERAGAASSAISVSSARLRSLLARQLALPANTPSAQLAEAAVTRLGWKDSGLGKALAQADVAVRAQKAPAREALQLVQKLEEFASKLDIRSHSGREKT